MLSESALGDPDYCKSLLTSVSSRDAKRGDLHVYLPTLTLETVQQVLALGNQLARQKQYELFAKAYDSEEERLADVQIFHRLLKTSHAIELVARMLQFQIKSYGKFHGFDENEEATQQQLQRYNNAVEQVAHARQQLLSMLQTIREGRNPLGLEDGDIPLYLNPNANDALGKNNALTDFFLPENGGHFTATGSAAEAVAELTAARAAFIQMRDRQLQVAQVTQQEEDRLLGIKQNYGQRLLGLCGSENGISSTAAGFFEDSEDGLSISFKGQADDCVYKKTASGCSVNDEDLFCASQNR